MAARWDQSKRTNQLRKAVCHPPCLGERLPPRITQPCAAYGVGRGASRFRIFVRGVACPDHKSDDYKVAKRGLARLKAEHPFCCFCGGRRHTISADHQPARVFFRSKRLPDGFVFPACKECQEASRRAEAALSLLIVPQERGERDRGDLRSRAAYYHRNDPALIENLWATRRQKRQILRDLEIERPPGASLDDIPLVKMEVDTWKPHLDIFALKLVLALHYRYVGSPLSHDGRVYPCYFFNAQIRDGRLLHEFQEAAQNLENPRHGKEILEEQMQVRWSVDVEHRAGVFLVHLHGMLFVFGVTADHPEWRQALEKDGDADVRGPLMWAD
jgi:hypothetical protein